MNKTTRTYLILLGIGLIAGILGGLFGIGGGVFVAPGLAFFLGFEQRKAHGTSLVAAFILSSAGVAAYTFRGHMDILLAAEVAVGAIFGALLGGRFASAFKSRTARLVFGVLILAVAVVMFIGVCAVSQPNVAGQMSSRIVVGVGILAGFVSAVMGIGGGIVMIPAMVIMLCVPEKVAHGVALATVLPTAFLGILLGYGAGNVDLRVGSIVGLGAIAGVAIGSAIALAVTDNLLRMGFAIFLALVAILVAMKKS